MKSLTELVARLADRDTSKAEAAIQADVRQLLLEAPLDLDTADLRDITVEAPVGDSRRIDVEVGMTVIEVKRDLRKGKVRSDAVEQLAGYVAAREEQAGCRYVGILTDGCEWRCYHLRGDQLAEASTYRNPYAKPDVDGLVTWLDGVMATVRGVPPTPAEIQKRLGGGSSAHALDRASLAELYAAHRDLPSLRMKRLLWAELLTRALGSQFPDDDGLFVEHTLLVNSAEVIAHAILGLPVETLAPAALLEGRTFEERGVHGVVEADFFDWVVEVPGGEQFIRTLARRLGRFDWHRVDHDILKVLYESVIDAKTRKQLGEYYTPDWLAEAIVERAVEDPLDERVLDPACGSGTFLFHAVRRYVVAAEKQGMALPDVLRGVTSHVFGLDLHPVAVTLARVTYLLAMGQERLTNPERPAIHVPVYLGDTLQWHQQPAGLWSAGQLVVRVDRDRGLFGDTMSFPGEILANAQVFDELVSELAKRASVREVGSEISSLSGLFERLGIAPEHQEAISETFTTMCRLHDEGRDHIWSYYIRNLARPVWLSREENRVDVVLGNPPWLAFRHMPAEMQERFRDVSAARGLWHGAKVATQQDLSALFVVTAVQLYLRLGGRLAFVMPNAALDRAQFAGFRKGEYGDEASRVALAFGESWDLRRLRPHFFPRGAAVVFGRRAEQGTAMPAAAERWSGRLDTHGSSWAEVRVGVSRTRTAAAVVSLQGSPYAERFANGATVFPRLLFLIEEQPGGPLGVPAGKVAVRSRRSAYEKSPWKDLPDMEGVVERQFVAPLWLGETILPYRSLPPARAVIPWDEGLLTSESERAERYPGLRAWLQTAEGHWLMNRSSDRLTFGEQLDYRSKLSKQFPIPAQRVVYAKAGMHLAATRLNDPAAIVDHKLYWAPVENPDAAHYLCAILNSATVTALVRPLMSYGKDERDIDKHVWKLPIPLFDPTNPLHADLAGAGRAAEDEVAALALDTTKNFVALRRLVRTHLAESEIGQRIEASVTNLIREE